MIQTLNCRTKFIDERKVDVVYFDFSRAFDRVSRTKLPYKVGWHTSMCNCMDEVVLD